jgi:hypothetical protein
MSSIIINNYDLFREKFDEEDLINNIDNLSLSSILKTQKLSLEFCVKYILSNDLYCKSDEDTYLCLNDVLLYQRHITKKEIFGYYINARK